jgi:hypothetical protein
VQPTYNTLMRLHEIENWARRIVARVKRGEQREDSLVELKAKWPDPRWSARQLAAHANAARGNPILWIVGLDEQHGIVGAAHNEVGDWYAQIRAEFESGVAPSLLGHPTFDEDGHSLTPLLFSTDRPPYVVRNPARDSPKSGPFSLEVPWREGTNVRSAGRAELLQILTEQVQLPTIELLAAESAATRNKAAEATFVAWNIELEIYFTCHSREPLVFPFHRMLVAARLTVARDVLIEFPKPHISPPLAWSRDEGRRNLSATIESTSDELIVQGSGMAYVRVNARSGDIPNLEPQSLLITLRLFAAGHTLPVALELDVPWARSEGISENAVGYWKLGTA